MGYLNAKIRDVEFVYIIFKKGTLSLLLTMLSGNSKATLLVTAKTLSIFLDA